MEAKRLFKLLEEHKILLNKLRKLALKSFSKGRYDLSINSIRAFATIAANINFIYADDELESLLGDIAIKLVENRVCPASEGLVNRIVFYDGFGCTNAPLSLQYIRALKAIGEDVLYIYEDIKGRVDLEIERELSSTPQFTVFKLSSSLSPSQKILEAFEIITRFNPSKALLHLGEVHVEAVVLFSLFPKVEKYRINLGDHHFWFGAKQLDFCIEFRGYGAEISIQKRGIPSNKLLYQPYYPIIDDRPFEGFPFERDADDVVIFSGGRLFKIFGRDYEYFSIVKRILEDNPRVKFVLAGRDGGDSNFINKFIKRHGFQDRFYRLGHRNDINEVFKRSDLYLNTYPQSGGLMCMYAAVNLKPILTYTTKDLPENRTENLLFQYSSMESITFDDKELFFNHVSKLIDDDKYRLSIGQEMSKYVISHFEFKELLFANLVLQVPSKFDSVEIDYDAIVKLNLEMECIFYNITSYALLKSFSWRVFFLFPQFSIVSRVVRFILSRILKRFIQ